MPEAKRTIPHMVLASAARFGDVEALRGEDGSVIFYRELEGRIREAAAAFCASGIEAGDRVAIWAPNSVAWIIAALGAQSVGAAIVPLNTRLKGREAGYILRTSGARMLLTVSEFLGAAYPEMLRSEDLPALQQIVLLGGDKGGVGWQEFLEHGAAVPPSEIGARLDALGEDDVCDILFTSGTTGNPKGAVTTHRQNIWVYQRYSKTYGLRPADRFLIINPFFHSFGYKAGWLAAFLTGCTVLPHAIFDAQKVLKRIEDEKASVLPGPPTIYQGLLAADYRAHDLSSLRLAITGAASVPVSLVEEMRTELGIDTVLTAYGLTETCGVVTMCRKEDGVETIANTAGRPLDGIEIRIVDDGGTTLPPGEAGELLVRGPGVMQGYFNDPVATADAIDAEGWLRTGDIAVQDARGYIRITDRAKDVFIVGGFNAYPAEIENILAMHPAIAQSAVIGVPDERMGEVPKAFVVLRPGADATPEAITAWARENMANYKVPRSVEIVDALPLNAAGKVQKFLLKG